MMSAEDISRLPKRPARWPFVLVIGTCTAVSLYAFAYLAGIDPPPGIRGNGAGMGWLVLHASFGGVALLLGPWQFVVRLRARRPRLHRWIGRCYVAACFVSGGAGLMLASNAINGPIVQAGFAGLGVSWLLATAYALVLAMRRDFVNHRRWMIRSFALTCSAITLRIYIPAMLVSQVPFTAGYPVIAWLCWVPNLLAAEWILRSPVRGAHPAA